MFDPKVSVIVITRNEGAELAATVENLRSTLPDARRELIVVDDGSTDGSADFLEGVRDVLLFRSEGLGVAKARNFGASQATGDAVVFADAHVRAPENWYQPLLTALEDSEVGAVAPGIFSLTEPERKGFGLELTGADLHARWLHRRTDTPLEVPVLPGAFLAMRRETFVKTGGFDAGLRQLGGNDNELSCRLWLLGYQQLVVPQVEVGHLFRATTPYPSTWSAVVHNRLRMAFVHFESARVERVLKALRAYEAFPAGLAMMLDTDVLSRRSAMARERRFDDEWFFKKFELTC
ncbi:MAG TPA: glycosyltransferase [Candidatus Sulfopaludibacter sp.]|jgi:GT2 family glycosyltransferase|nr:glycosyltransferase [Candidatus Sulfopaludibacter sp.]